MAFIAILDTQIDPDAPITSGLGYQFRDNLDATAAGDDGAPRVVSRALNISAMTGTGDFNEATIASIDRGSVGVDIILVQVAGEYVSTGTGTSDITLQGSVDGVSYTTLTTVFSTTGLDADEAANASALYDGNGGTEYRYYRIREGGDSDKEFTGFATGLFIGGDTS